MVKWYIMVICKADLFKLIKKIRFRKDHNHYQTELNKDIKEVKNLKYIWMKTDKHT